MNLRELLKDIPCEIYSADGEKIRQGSELENIFLDRKIRDITNDSRKAGEGMLFFAIRGANSDGHDYAPQVAANGAAAILSEHPLKLALDGQDVTKLPAVVCVNSTRRGMAFVSAAFYGHPSRRMKMIGITGTKGKTTTTYLVRSILEKAGIDMGLIGTIESAWHEVHRPSNNTTPESIDLQRTLKEMADDGVQAVVMEVSSQGPHGRNSVRHRRVYQPLGGPHRAE